MDARSELAAEETLSGPPPRQRGEPRTPHRVSASGAEFVPCTTFRWECKLSIGDNDPGELG
jgi:hypothetical protein